MSNKTKKLYRKAYHKYLKIKYWFSVNNPKAQYKWDKFIFANNGFSIVGFILQNHMLIAEF